MIYAQLNNYYFINVPLNATDFDNEFGGMLFFKRNNLERFCYLPKKWYFKKTIIGKLSDVLKDETACKQIVEGFFRHDNSENFDCFKNYNKENKLFLTYPFSRPSESLQSFIDTLPKEKEWLIFRKAC